MARTWLAFIARLVAGLLVSASVIAAEQCTAYGADAYGWGWSRDEACQLLASHCSSGGMNLCMSNGQNPSGTATYIGPGTTATACKFNLKLPGYPGSCGSAEGCTTSNVYVGVKSAECPPPSCTDSTTRYTKNFSSGWPGPSSYCLKSTNCTINQIFAGGNDAAGKGYAIYESTGQDCGTEGDYDGQGADSTACSVVNGQTLCNKPGETNCGTVNGESVCLGDHPDAPADTGCKGLSGGGKNCGDQAPTPPAPDTGTPGVPAPPDMTINIHEGSTNTTNYYFNHNTVAGSSGVTPSEGGEPACDPATDTGCTDVGKDWVDRENWTPPGVPGFDSSMFSKYDADETWGDGDGKLRGKADSFGSFMKGVFPFSLLASPVLALSTTAQPPPQISVTFAGHTASANLSMWDSLFALVRAAEGVMLIYGFYLVCLATVRGWSS